MPPSAVLRPVAQRSRGRCCKSLAERVRASASRRGGRPTPPPSTPATAPSSSRFRPIVFMAYLDEGMGEAYVSPQIEAALGFSQRNGSKTRSAGINTSIRTTRRAGGSRRHTCCSPAIRSAPRIASSPRDGCVLLVPLPGEDCPSRRRPALVHPRRGLRHHRPEAGRAGAAGGTQPRRGDSRHGRRAGRRARSAGPHRPLQPCVRADDRGAASTRSATGASGIVFTAEPDGPPSRKRCSARCCAGARPASTKAAGRRATAATA